MRRHVGTVFVRMDETAEQEIAPDNYKDGGKQSFAPLPEPTANGLGAAAAAEHGNQHDTEYGIGQHTTCRIYQSANENAAAVVHVTRQIAHGSHVGGERTRMQGYYEP